MYYFDDHFFWLHKVNKLELRLNFNKWAANIYAILVFEICFTFAELDIQYLETFVKNDNVEEIVFYSLKSVASHLALKWALPCGPGLLHE